MHLSGNCDPHRSNMVEIKAADIACELDVVRQIFREYATSLEIDLCFQNFEEELASLPGKYQVPQGRLLLAWDEQMVVGCVALRPIDVQTCEMKRLYVRPQARGQQLGRRLAARICDEAKQAGYQRICLDTLPSMTAAIQLYEWLGFKRIGPYVFNPVKGAIFLGLELKRVDG
jgi:ribosomal protein S18 acetylase RimI-like enzyme